MATTDTNAAQETISAATTMDLSRYVLILGNFTNLPSVTALSENRRYIFTPPKESHNWKGAMTGEIRGPFLALEFEKDMYDPDGWMIGSSNNTDRCDVQIAVAGGKSGISRQHLRIGLDVESTYPRLTQITNRNPLSVIVHVSRGDRRLLLTQNKSVKIETCAPITVNFGTSSFQAWRPTLTSPDESNRYHQRLEKHFKNYFDTVPVVPSIQPLSGAETLAVRFGQNSAVYKREEELGKGTNGTVYRVVEATSGKIYAAKEPYYKASDSGAKRVERFERLKAEYDKLVELKHPFIVEGVELLLVADNRQLPPWMIMEYIEDSLDSTLTCFKGAQSLVIIPQFIEAIEFMHAKNYVHRDIKPGNILIKGINDQPVLKIADVGAMKEAGEGLKTFIGTPVYMAPECWLTTRRYSKEVDMWAVGLVLMQLFTDWDPKTDDAWVDGPYGKINEIGFSTWISEVLAPLIATAVPKSVQPLLRGLLVESPKDRWTATRCHMWVKEDLMPHVDSATDEARRKRRRNLDQQDFDEDNFRIIRSSNPTLDTIRANSAGHLYQRVAADSLPDTLPWGAEYRPRQSSDTDLGS